MGAALVFLVLPLAAAAWAVADWESTRTRSQAETAMQEALREASSDFRHSLAGAAVEARLLASSDRVQRAFERRDRRRLARLSRANVRFVLGPAAQSDAVPSRSVRIVVGGRRVGTVTVSVPFDRRLLARLEHASPLTRHSRLAFAHGR